MCDVHVCVMYQSICRCIVYADGTYTIVFLSSRAAGRVLHVQSAVLCECRAQHRQRRRAHLHQRRGLSDRQQPSVANSGVLCCVVLCCVVLCCVVLCCGEAR